jgi:hypothetical protein
VEMPYVSTVPEKWVCNDNISFFLLL